MITYLLGDAEVDRYLNDLALRLRERGVPDVFVTLGQSGQNIAFDLANILNGMIDNFDIKVLHATYERTGEVVRFFRPDKKEISLEDLSVLADKRILVIDSAIHSGSSMLAVCERLASSEVEDVLSYSLVLKRGSCFVPTYFGILIREEDRAYFKLSAIPNNRLIEKKKSFGYLRPIQKEDVGRSDINTGVDAVGANFGGLLYDDKAHGSQTYLFIKGMQAIGAIQFKLEEKKGVFVNIVAVDKQFHGLGVGESLLRWSESLARSSGCREVTLWAINDRIGYYEKMGFFKANDDAIPCGAGALFTYMKKRVLYNIIDEQDEDEREQEECARSAI